jgi:uncharacterized protein YceH (UPF0502 family)
MATDINDSYRYTLVTSEDFSIRSSDTATIWLDESPTVAVSLQARMAELEEQVAQLTKLIEQLMVDKELGCL